jgi:putative transport protein
MDWAQAFFQKYPELAVYLALGVGYGIGGVKLGGFSLGGSTGSLLAGLLIGALLETPVNATAKSVLFMLFLFGIGYSVGPKFAKAMKGDGWRFAVLGVFVPVVGLLTAWAVAAYLRLDPGFAGGLVSGALTESPAMGTASEAIQGLAISPDEQQRLIGHVAVADALCYVFGAFGVIWVCGSLGPRLLGLDLQKEAAQLEQKFGIERNRPGTASGWRPFVLRAFRVTPEAATAWGTASALERSALPARLFVVRLRREERIVEGDHTVDLRAGDVVAVSGPREAVVDLATKGLVEVEDRELLDLTVATYDVFLTSKDLDGQTLADIATRAQEVRSVYLRKIVRDGQDVPIGPGTVLERGDVVRLVGPEATLDQVAKRIGAVVSPTDITDFPVMGLAIVVGALVGVLAGVNLGGFRLSLGSSVGVLLAGILVGYIRGRRPLFGRIPDAAISFMQSIGLSGFVAMVGIGAGPHFMPAIREAGLGLFLGGIVVTLTPQIAGLYFGRYVLKVNPLLLLGGLSGAQTFTPGLAAVQDKSGSPIAVLGYSGAVAIAHVLLPMWGAVIVALMSGNVSAPPG